MQVAETNRTSTPNSVADSLASQGVGPSARIDAAGLIAQATDARTGVVDTRQLGGLVADAARQDFDAASRAHAEIEAQLTSRNPADAARFNQDVVAASSDATAAPAGLTGAAQGMADAGYRVQVKNPILSVSWESTTSPITGKGGFTQGLRTLLESNNLTVVDAVNARPAGSVQPNATISRGVANNINGAAAENAIADRLRAQFPDATVQTQVPVQEGRRIVDVQTDIPNATDPRNAQRLEVESKLGRQGASGLAPRQAALDGERLAANQTIRGGGQLLENVGRVARPVGMVMDAVEIGQAFRADGNRIGENTGRAASGLAGGAAGGWGGAAAGAAIGTMIFPGVGTVAGGVIGGIAGAFAGDSAGKGMFDTVRSWF